MKPIIVVATAEERKLAEKAFKGHKIIQTGVGGVNVYQTLKNVPRWRKIVNYGYAGSNNIPIGKEVRVMGVTTYHPNVTFLEPEWIIAHNGVMCYTAGDFVTNTNIKDPCVFDMELAYIKAMGFKNVEAIKIVSDNLSLEQYEEVI